MRKTIFKKIMTLFLCLALLLTHLPIVAKAAPESGSTSIADPKTLSEWQTWFPTNSSRYAGGVFIDKSVYTATEAKEAEYFADIRNSLSLGTDNFGNENFLVALSALGSNSEVLGYSHIPTDTVLVLDASTSMGTGNAATTAIDDMVNGANDAIKRLLALNNYNRVGVVIYNGTASVLLPLDRYTVNNANGNLLTYSRSNNQNRINISSNVTDGEGRSVRTSYIAQGQGTYTQGGIYAAAELFLQADPVIEDGKIQGGTNRIPIMVLMSDGEPSYRTQTGPNTTINRYNAATNDNVDRNNFHEDDITAFSTILTAAWSEAEISAWYGEDARFYTLGYALSANHDYAHNVLDPLNPNNNLYSRFKGFSDRYLAMDQGDTQTFNGSSNFRVTRLSDPDKVTSLDYVDRYWQASNANLLNDAFSAIVDEIIIQSRYYSTLVSNGQYQQDGFISFTDEIGTYMEVKDIKGIYIGEGKLVSGGMFAEFITTGKVQDFDSEQYSDEALVGFENEVLSSMSERFSIRLSNAAQLIESAKQNGFLYYNSPSDFSNYVAWYADADNSYLAPYTGTGHVAPANAKYIVRSYFYMGDVTQNHVETSMLYTLVRVREDIESGRQIVDMNVPAALLPLITYTITVDGDTFTSDNITGITCEQRKPITLLFEVGLDRDITPINLTEKVKEGFRKDDSGIYTFYTNRWRDDNGNTFTIPANPDAHIFNHGIMNSTVAQFIPSLENERFYYTENKQIYDANHNLYTGSKPSENGTYYVVYNWVEGSANSASLNTTYNAISSEILKDSDAIIQIDGKPGWFVKEGTPQFYFGEEVHGEQAHSHKTQNPTNTLGFSDYPHVAYHEDEGHTGYHMLNYLGNNGLVNATPAQGIKLTKTVSEVVDGAADVFTFEVLLSDTTLASSYPVYIEHADGTIDEPVDVSVNNVGILSISIGAGDTAYIIDLPVGTRYTVTESDNIHYAATSTNAEGTVIQNTLSAVSFVNSPKGYGSLLVEKEVRHPFTTISDEIANQDFTITVAFEGVASELAQIVVSDQNIQSTNNGQTYTFTLKDGQDVLFTNIPEHVKYTVSETNLPSGYTLLNAPDTLAGRIENDIQSEALLVNNYSPASVSPRITISGEKSLSGRDWDPNVDHYQVALQQLAFGGQDVVAVGDPQIVNIVKNDSDSDYNIDMSGISYDNVGTYSYIVYEVFPGEENRIENISYDTSFALFSVDVVDRGTGALIVDNVIVHQQTASLSGDAANGWAIAKDFANKYLTNTVRFPVVKKVVDIDDANHELNAHRGGIMLALYDSVTAETPVYSTITDEVGNANFILTVDQNDFASTRYYYLREIIPLVSGQVVGMTYDTEFKYVVAIDWSDASLDAPVVQYYHYNASAANGLGEEITDISSTPMTIINTYDDGVVSTTIDLGGHKTVNGGALRANDTFTFALYETDATFNINGLTPIQEKTVTSQSADGAYSFDGVTFATEGTKYLVIAEQKGTAGGITYDGTQYHITVNVAKAVENNKTILVANVTHVHRVGYGDVTADQLNFNNLYRVNDNVEINVNGKKNLNGRDLLEGEFFFGIFEENSSTPLHIATNDKDGNFSFPTIEISVQNQISYDSTLTYTIKEMIPDSTDTKGITYTSDGKTEYKLEVNLKANENGGITTTYLLDGQPVSDVNVTFTNEYTATGTSLTLSGTKHLENKADGTFTFGLYETGNDFVIGEGLQPVTENATVANGSGTYAFHLNYTNTDRGDHYYVLKEIVPDDTLGVSYDPSEYHITVNVMDNGHGEMEARVLNIVSAYTPGSFTASNLDFINSYEAAATEYEIRGTKQLIGELQLDDDMFEFVLSNSEGEIARVTNLADGSIIFPTQVFDEARDYIFYITETHGGEKIDNISYDASKYIIIIPVIDDGEGYLYVDDGNIHIEKELNRQTEVATAVAFTNEYHKPGGGGGGHHPQPEPTSTPEPSVFISPRTGDYNNMALWITLLLLSGVGIICTALFGKTKKEED